MFDLSSKLSCCMGIMEGADVPDIFGDSIASVSSWSSNYYTIDPSSGFVDFVTNLGGSAFNSQPSTTVQQGIEVTTDPDGTTWFWDDDESMANSNVVNLATADDIIASSDTAGVITITSMRMRYDQALNRIDMRNTGPSWGGSGMILWRNIQATSDPLSLGYKLALYRQFTTLWPTAPDGQWRIGPLRDFDGAVLDGDYEVPGEGSPPAGSGGRLNTPAYLAGDDIVVSWFFQPGGIRCMVNGVFVPLYVAEYHPTINDWSDVTAGESAVLATDFSVYGALQRQSPPVDPAVSPGNWTINWGSSCKMDYQGMFSGAKSDSFVKAAHALLLNGKPTS